MITPTQFWILWDIFILLIVLNFVPTCIAYMSHHPDKQLLASLNIVSLFSFVLWIALMGWALGGKRTDSAWTRFLADRQKRRMFVGGVLAFVTVSFGSTLYGLGVI